MADYIDIYYYAPNGFVIFIQNKKQLKICVRQYRVVRYKNF